MRFHLHARSPNSAGFLLIAAISGRALAAAARRAGYRPLVADLFCDTDTVAIAERAMKLPGDLQSGIDPQRLIPTLRQLARDDRPVAVVLGSGFERKTEAVEAVASQFPLAGNRAAAIRRVKDPQSLAADCAALGIPHPAFRLGSAARSGELGGQDRGRRRRLAYQAGRTAKRRHRTATSSVSFAAAASRPCS